MPEAENAWPALPTETEIYILPNGEIVVADLPAELAAQLGQLTPMPLQEICAEESPPDTDIDPSHVANQQHPTQPT